MGAHICQFGVTHRRCRCIKTHHMSCPTPEECAALREDVYSPKHKK